MRVWQVSNKGQRIWPNSKQSQTAYEDLRMKNLTLALVGIFINLRRQAIEVSFGKEISSTLQGRAWFRSSNHITLVNYLDSMGSLWRNRFTRTKKNVRNKEYTSLFMKAHGVWWWVSTASRDLREPPFRDLARGINRARISLREVGWDAGF